jgi:hypothetical protein
MLSRCSCPRRPGSRLIDHVCHAASRALLGPLLDELPAELALRMQRVVRRAAQREIVDTRRASASIGLVPRNRRQPLRTISRSTSSSRRSRAASKRIARPTAAASQLFAPKIGQAKSTKTSRKIIAEATQLDRSSADDQTEATITIYLQPSAARRKRLVWKRTKPDTPRNSELSRPRSSGLAERQSRAPGPKLLSCEIEHRVARV